jgi:putative transposase
MREWPSLAPVKWECKYHVVIVPKYRRKIVFGRVRKRVGKVSSNYAGRRTLGS